MEGKSEERKPRIDSLLVCLMAMKEKNEYQTKNDGSMRTGETNYKK